jgi:glycosyltransferase involved in cell wall biosynthesis
MLGLGRIPSARITIVPNGVKRELFDPRPLPDRSFWEEYGLRDFVLEVARIQEAKNQLGLIEALYDLPVPIVFVGQPSPYETEYADRCYELGKARGNVYFVGTKSPQELAGIYALAGVHVLPSWRETPGLASLEAAAAGCRVVTTGVGSAREYFTDLVWYCDPRNPMTIRRAVTHALETPPSDELRRRVLDRYTWDMAAKATLEAYYGVLRST